MFDAGEFAAEGPGAWMAVERMGYALGGGIGCG
jgi:hypothetical protein